MRSYNDEEEGDGVHMLGFMFGNVDNSGSLDEEYLEELDVNQHLAMLAHQLGPSLVDAGENGSGSEEQEDYDLKADDAVDYEDIDEQYEGAEVDLTPEHVQFYADAGLAAPANLVEEDDYDEDDYDEDDCDEDDYDEDDYDEDDYDEDDYDDDGAFDSELDGSEVEDEDGDDKEFPSGQEQCQTSVVDVIPLLSSNEEEHDWDQVLGVQETTSSANEKKEKVAKYPVLCQVDGKDLVRFTKLCGGEEPYWITGHRKGRHTRGRVEEGPVAVEDDEEVELKRCPESESSVSEDSQGGSSSVEEDGIMQTSHSHRHRLKQRKLAFSAAEPMKVVDVDFYESDVAESLRQIPDANFVPIHQVEWEDDILWDTPKGHRTSYHLSKIDHKRPSTELSGDSEWQRPCVIESLCQRSSELKELTMSSKGLRHPQMLRLDQAHSFGGQIDVRKRAALLKRIRDVTLKVEEKNQELARGEWLSGISWGGLECGLAKPLVILDLMDPQMVFEAKSGQSTSLHAAAVVLTPGRDEGAHDGAERATVNASLSRFNFSNDEYYTYRQSHEQQNSNAKRRRAIHMVNVIHSLPAIKLQTMKLELSEKDLANFHRPKAVWYPHHHNEAAAKGQRKLAARDRMEVIVATLSGKGSKLTVDAFDTVDVLKAKTAKQLGDLEPSEKTKVFYAGKELVDTSTLAQQQVRPNSVLRFVRTKIYPWPKAQRLPGEDEPLRPPGAFKNKSELSVKDGHVALMEYCEERPLILGNVGMGGRLCTYYRKRSPTDTAAFALYAEQGRWVGTILPLEPTDVSPFLGDIRPGETQSSLETNMYRAPVFPHKVATTDFLLVRSSQGKLSLRRIDSVHVVGQQEPHIEVLTPNSTSVRTYRCNRLMAYVYRLFREFKEKPGAIITSPHVRADDIISPFSSFSESIIRRRLSHCADLKQIGGEMYWVMRPDFRIPSEGELRRMMTPEDVCTYESMQAGLHHLKRMGVRKFTQPSGLAAAINQLPNERKLRAVASHIESVLQVTPWNLSHNFVAATMQGLGSLEQLEILGAGDPSGRGLGFSYLRAAIKPNTAGKLVAKKAAAARGGAPVTGSDADLRRLGTEAAREILLKFQVPEETISKLGRWQRIGLIRRLSNKQAASGVERGAAALIKFARGQKMSFLQLRQQTQEKCQGVWDRQAQSLSMADGDDLEVGDGAAGGDLASFVGDLENHLEESTSGAATGDLDTFAEFLESHIEDEGRGKKRKQEGMGGLKARLLKRIAQEGEDSEDEEEEEEAAELMQMLRADDEAGEKQKKKRSDPAINEKELEDIEPPLGKKNASKTANQEGEAQKGSNELKKSGARIKEVSNEGKGSGKVGRNMSWLACGACGQFGHMRTNKTCPLYKEGHKPVAWQASAAAALALSERQGSGALMEAMPMIKAKVSGKLPEQNTVSLACGACGQFGHMRTNKKCPLYNQEEREPVPWQEAGADALGLVERQGTKIIVKRKFINSLPEKILEGMNLSKSVQPPVIQTPLPKQTPPPSPLFNSPSTLRVKMKLSGANQNLDTSPAPSVSKPSRERVEQQHGAHTDVSADLGAHKAASGPPSGLFKERNYHGKGIKRGLDVSTSSHNRTPGLKRSRRRGGVVDLYKILEGVVDTLENADCSYLFRKPVPKKAAPDYLHYVKRPMDLSTIRDRVRKLKYTSREEFRNDVLQIAKNAHLYNEGRNPGIPPLADRLLELCDEELVAKGQDLDDAEAGVVAESARQGVA